MPAETAETSTKWRLVWPETIEAIVALIEALIESGHAYEAEGDVYFRVRSFDGYGKLSNRRTDDMDQGEEAGVHPPSVADAAPAVATTVAPGAPVARRGESSSGT